MQLELRETAELVSPQGFTMAHIRFLTMRTMHEQVTGDLHADIVFSKFSETLRLHTTVKDRTHPG